MTLSSRHS